MYQTSDPQTSFFGSMIYDQVIPQDHSLRKLAAAVDFSFVNERCKGFYKDLGRPCIEPQRMFKMLLLQYLYNLSDARVEQEVNDRLSFKWFLGLEVHQHSPDSTSLVYFRDRLGAETFADLFNEVVSIAKDKGLVSDQLHIVDATAVRAKVDLMRVRSKWSKERKDKGSDSGPNKPPPDFVGNHSPDPNARFGHTSPTKKVYGYKAYIQMDEGSEFIVSATVDPANQQEANHLPELLEAFPALTRPKKLLADKAYDTPQNHQYLQDAGIESGILRKRLPKNKVLRGCFAQSHNQSREEFISLAKRRAQVEHKIADLKHWHHLRVARYWGLAKMKIQLFLTATAVNLKRMIKILNWNLAPPQLLVA